MHTGAAGLLYLPKKLKSETLRYVMCCTFYILFRILNMKFCLYQNNGLAGLASLVSDEGCFAN